MVMTGVEISLLDVKKLSYLLVEGYWQVSVVDEIESTQTYLTTKNPMHGEVIAAEFQRAGRGRLDRSFDAQKSKSLLFSFYVEPKRSRSEWGWIPLIAGMAVESVLNRQKNIFFTKWPNDVLVSTSPANGKVAGILSETHSEGVVVGIGINVAMNFNEIPVPTATSLAMNEIPELDRNFYLAEVLKEFAKLLSAWEKFEDLSERYAERSSTIGLTVEVHGLDGKIESGKATGIGPGGELILEGDRHIYSGDVIHLYT